MKRKLININKYLYDVFFNRETILSLKGEGGYLLIEVMVAVSLLTVGFLGILKLSSNAIGLNRVVSDQFIANYLAMEGIEVVKNIIDANVINARPWGDDLNSGNFEISYNGLELEYNQRRYIKFDENIVRYNYQSGIETPFIRTIYIDNLSSDEIKVNSIVSWTGREGTKFDVNLEDHFFNWKL